MSDISGRRRFSYGSIDELRDDIEALDLDVPLQDDVMPLAESHSIDGQTIPNSMCANPIEGRDATETGAPGDLSLRRYGRLAEGGSGIIWLEATAVTDDGRTFPSQLRLTEATTDEFETLIETIHERGEGPGGNDQRPYTVLQLTHSGRH